MRTGVPLADLAESYFVHVAVGVFVVVASLAHGDLASIVWNLAGSAGTPGTRRPPSLAAFKLRVPPQILRSSTSMPVRQTFSRVVLSSFCNACCIDEGPWTMRARARVCVVCECVFH